MVSLRRRSRPYWRSRDGRASATRSPWDLWESVQTPYLRRCNVGDYYRDTVMPPAGASGAGMIRRAGCARRAEDQLTGLIVGPLAGH